jgi:hypothetical protein
MCEDAYKKLFKESYLGGCIGYDDYMCLWFSYVQGKLEEK